MFESFGGGKRGGNDGGYFADGDGAGAETSGTTPKRAKGDQSRRAQNLLPVNTYQIRNANESVITIGGIEFSLDSDMYKPTVVEDVLCRVYGSIRSQGNEKLLMVFNIRPITTLNEVTSHFLEVIIVPKRIQKKNEQGAMNNMDASNDVPMNKAGSLGNSLMDMGAYGKTPMSNAQRQVLSVIKQFQDPGIHIKDINDHLTTKLSPTQINKICEDLMNEGHIYSSIDEFHFLCTEN